MARPYGVVFAAIGTGLLAATGTAVGASPVEQADHLATPAHVNAAGDPCRRAPNKQCGLIKVDYGLTLDARLIPGVPAQLGVVLVGRARTDGFDTVAHPKGVNRRRKKQARRRAQEQCMSDLRGEKFLEPRLARRLVVAAYPAVFSSFRVAQSVSHVGGKGQLGRSFFGPVPKNGFEFGYSPRPPYRADLGKVAVELVGPKFRTWTLTLGGKRWKAQCLGGGRATEQLGPG